MNRVFCFLAVMLALALAPVPETRADTPLPEDAELDGIYPREAELIDAIEDAGSLFPDLDDELRRRLSEAKSFSGRREVLRVMLAEVEEQAKKYAEQPFVDVEAVNIEKKRLEFLFGTLFQMYYGIHHGMLTPGDVLPLTSGEKRQLGIPLTEEQKRATGLDDYTPAEKRARDIPLTPEEWRRLQAEEEGEDRRTSQADPFMQPGIGVGARYGEIDRGNVSYLRTEFGGLVIDSAFAGIEREHEFKAIDGSVAFPLGTYSLGDKPFDLRLFAAGTYAFGDLDMDGDLIPAGGNQLAILGPEGPSGPLGGGLVTAAGFGDVTDWSYSDDYDEILVRGGLEAQSAFADPEVRIRPRLGFLYGRTDNDSRFSGFTNADTVFFEYDTEVESDRYGAELGLYAEIPVAGSFSVYLDGAARVTYDDARGSTSLKADVLGAPFPSEEQRYSDSGWHLGGTIGGGLAVDIGQVRGSIGAEFETWKVPVARVTGEEPASIDFQSRDSWVIEAQLQLRF